MLKAILFDLDGVICSTDEYHYQAWKDMASEVSMREAIYKAIDIFRCRRNFLEASGNPLRKMKAEKPEKGKGERKSGPENHGKEKKNSGENPVQEVRGKEAE